MEEYLHAKRSLKLGKCAGPDNIPPEVLKTCDLDDIILSFCNQVLMNGRKPDQCRYQTSSLYRNRAICQTLTITVA